MSCELAARAGTTALSLMVKGNSKIKTVRLHLFRDAGALSFSDGGTQFQ
jgi:hypothetical protein